MHVFFHRIFYISVRSTPHPLTVTTRIITFLVGNPYKTSFATVTGWGVDPIYLYFFTPSKTHMEPKTWLFVDFCLGSTLVFRSVKRTNIVVTFSCRKPCFGLFWRRLVRVVDGISCCNSLKGDLCNRSANGDVIHGVFAWGDCILYITLVFQVPCE